MCVKLLSLCVLQHEKEANLNRPEYQTQPAELQYESHFNVLMNINDYCKWYKVDVWSFSNRSHAKSPRFSCYLPHHHPLIHV